MKRTQIQLDDWIHEALRRQAYQRGSSVAAVVREILSQSLQPERAKRRHTMRDFSFVASGRSDRSDLEPISERHDEAFVEAIEETR